MHSILIIETYFMLFRSSDSDSESESEVPEEKSKKKKKSKGKKKKDKKQVKSLIPSLNQRSLMDGSIKSSTIFSADKPPLKKRQQGLDSGLFVQSVQSAVRAATVVTSKAM